MGLYSTADGSLGIPGGNLPTFGPNPSTPGQPIPNGGFAYFPGFNLKYKIDWMYTGGVQVEQPIYLGGKIRAAYKMAKLGKEIAQLNETLTATEVILRTEQAYAQVVKAKEMQKVATTYHALLKELQKTVENAHKHGLKPQNDVLKVMVRLNESELSLRKAENALRLASMNLCHLIGKPLHTPIRVSDNLPIVQSQSTASAADITNRPEYAILNQQTAIAKQKVRLERSELLPKIGVRASYDYIHGLDLNDSPFFDQGGFTALLNVSVPLFHFGQRIHKVKAAKAQWEQTKLEQENLNEQMMLELTQAANNLEEARLESELAERSLQQAEENMRVSRKQYDVGLETLTDHMETQTLWQQAYETKVHTHFQYYLAHIAYLKATGQLVSTEK
ncbi:outer membrane efflux protein [gut metagenome]|uniref:Outer membrane efflux protein n=1 Tax=gut metagenome TaxID=749906 RepID=J9CI98_9ZZZZ